MSLLIIDDEVTNQIRNLRNLAELPENYYAPSRESDGTEPCPGDDPRYVIQLASCRVVYSITIWGKDLWRHISISTKANYPMPIVAFTIADLFGFTGWNETDKPPKGWGFLAKPEPERCIIICQKLERAE